MLSYGDGNPGGRQVVIVGQPKPHGGRHRLKPPRTLAGTTLRHSHIWRKPVNQVVFITSGLSGPARGYQRVDGTMRCPLSRPRSLDVLTFES